MCDLVTQLVSQLLTNLQTDKVIHIGAPLLKMGEGVKLYQVVGKLKEWKEGNVRNIKTVGKNIKWGRREGTLILWRRKSRWINLYIITYFSRIIL